LPARKDMSREEEEHPFLEVVARQRLIKMQKP
jgi:hypothetical protein